MEVRPDNALKLLWPRTTDCPCRLWILDLPKHNWLLCDQVTLQASTDWLWADVNLICLLFGYRLGSQSVSRISSRLEKRDKTKASLKNDATEQTQAYMCINPSSSLLHISHCPEVADWGWRILLKIDHWTVTPSLVNDDHACLKKVMNMNACNSWIRAG